MENIQDIEPSKLQAYLSELGDWALNKGFQLVLAIICMYLGMKLSRLIVKMIRKSFQKSNLEESVASFLLSLIKFGLYAIVFITAASIVGFQVTSLVTILGTASLAIGLALQGSLANFAGGVLILILKPFKVGDYIIENDKQCEGTVASIDIFYTKLLTYDNRIIVIPNGNITAHSLINVTAAGIRKLDLAVGVAYDSDLRKVKEVLTQVVTENSYYDKTREIDVFVDSFQDSCIKMGVRLFVSADDYWKAKWELNEQIKYAFDEHGIRIPFEQMEVTVKSKET
ncbi:MAG: mechanosensitive ion channel family protein [Wujia sp.]